MMADDALVCGELLTVLDWVRWTASEFERAELYFGHGTDNSWDEAVQLVLWVTNVPWQRFDQVVNARLTGTEKNTMLQCLRRRIEKRMPLPYVTGQAWFCGLPFTVNESVLVPRSPIAELIQSGFAPWLTADPAMVLDLCTGSGCIGIATAYAFPEAQVDLSDISAAALAVAELNIARHRCADRVRTVSSDLFEQLPGTYDLIVSNPPYVDADDMAGLPPEFRAEPRLALESGSDGLDFTRRLLQEAAEHLGPDGILVVEVGNSAAALEQAFPAVPFTWVELQNGGDGVFVLTREQLQEHAGTTVERV